MALRPTTDYVKFVRGSKAAFDAFQNKANDTLYFIYETDDTNKGYLYIGSRLISCTDASGSPVAGSLADIEDILITEVADKQILVYDAESGKWVNKSIDELIVEVDEVSIVKTAVGKLALNNFEAATVGSLASKGEDGSLNWVTPAQAVTALNVYTKEEIDAKIKPGLTRTIVDSVDDIDIDASDAEQYIYLIANENGSYDEYIVVNGAIDKVGDWEVDLDNYVTKAEVGTLVTNEFNSVLTQSIGDLTNYGGDNETLVEKVEKIEERLLWQELTID